MGYNTQFYGVRLDAVRGAVGSNDAAVRDRVARALRKRTGPPRPNPTAVVTVDGEIIFNGAALTPEAFEREVRRPEWAGAYLHWFHRPGETPGERRRRAASRFGAPGAADAFLTRAIDGHLSGMSLHRDEADLPDRRREFTVEAAVGELIAGTFTEREATHQYGYALEVVCAALGRRLGAVAGLAHLGLASPLAAVRRPVTLPASRGFPRVSYLTAAEVRAEGERVRGLDLSYPGDRSIARDRRRYAGMIGTAAGRGLDVVTFYY